jgi:hypothetical protein
MMARGESTRALVRAGGPDGSTRQAAGGRYLTMTLPSIPEWMMQTYLKVPRFLKVRL